MEEGCKAYLTADWRGDGDAFVQFAEWNQSRHWRMNLLDSRELTDGKNKDLYCVTKERLREKIQVCEKFILITGEHTAMLAEGACPYCNSYRPYRWDCRKGYPLDSRNFVKYECAVAAELSLDIVVLYKDIAINRMRCPLELKNHGTHVAMQYMDECQAVCWNARAVEDALKGKGAEEECRKRKGRRSDNFFRME